jgi:hypothetical protein
MINDSTLCMFPYRTSRIDAAAKFQFICCSTYTSSVFEIVLELLTVFDWSTLARSWFRPFGMSRTGTDVAIWSKTRDRIRLDCFCVPPLPSVALSGLTCGRLTSFNAAVTTFFVKSDGSHMLCTGAGQLNDERINTWSLGRGSFYSVVEGGGSSDRTVWCNRIQQHEI